LHIFDLQYLENKCLKKLVKIVTRDFNLNKMPSTVIVTADRSMCNVPVHRSLNLDHWKSQMRTIFVLIVIDTLPFQNLTDQEFTNLRNTVNSTLFVLKTLDIQSTSDYVQHRKVDKSLQNKKYRPFLPLQVNIICSLPHNISKLKELLNEIPFNPKIIAISETWLESSRLSSVQLPE